MPRPHQIPISRIPPELLAEILILCAPLRYYSVSERRSIIFPSQVCHYWRSTALSTTALWTFILFLCERPRHFAREAECARAWLSRSAQCPLSIEIDAWAMEETAELALQVFLPHCARWEAIHATELWLDPHMWSQVAGKLPLLESAHLYWATVGDAFAIAPRLQRLKLVLANELPVNALNLPWIQLTHLDLHIRDGDAKYYFLVMLQQAPNITTLEICLFAETAPFMLESPVFTHPNISTLKIVHDMDEESVKWFLDSLVLPALRILSLSNQWPCATSLLSRSACHLSSLYTHLDNPFDVSELQQLPRDNSLTRLEVTVPRLEDWESVVECLTHRRNTYPFKNLRHLKMSSYSYPSTSRDMDIFADMVASRWRRADADPDPESARCATLSRVELIVLDDISMHHVAISRLRNFAAEGLDVTVSSGVDREKLL